MLSGPVISWILGCFKWKIFRSSIKTVGFPTNYWQVLPCNLTAWSYALVYINLKAQIGKIYNIYPDAPNIRNICLHENHPFKPKVICIVHIPYMEHLGLFFGGVCGKIMGRVTIIGRVDAYLEPAWFLFGFEKPLFWRVQPPKRRTRCDIYQVVIRFVYINNDTYIYIYLHINICIYIYHYYIHTQYFYICIHIL